MFSIELLTKYISSTIHYNGSRSRNSFVLPFKLKKNTRVIMIMVAKKNNKKLGAFEAEDVIHVEGEVNPVKDMEVINEELRLKDEEYFNANLEKLEKLAIRGGDKKLKPEYVCSSLTISLERFSYIVVITIIMFTGHFSES